LVRDARADAAMKPVEQVAIAVERARRRAGNICDSVIVYARTISRCGRNLMTAKSTVVVAVAFSLAIGVGAALAQNPAPSAHQAAAGATTKQAISKACSNLANAKNLHGKERKKFRSKCKRKGGKM
jgi:psiF repeat